jgi:hypothetical protein
VHLPSDPTVLVAARDEGDRIAATIASLRAALPGVEVIVADDGSRDGTADEAEAAGALVLRLRRRGKGEALSAAERAAPPGPVLLCDADLTGSPAPLAGRPADLAVAAFARRDGGGFGLAKRTARAVVRLRSGFHAREPLSGQRFLSPRARAACFPLAPGFGCEVRMTIDAVRAGLAVEEVELDLGHRATARDLAGFLHRGRQLRDLLLAAGPLAVNYRGRRLPLLGWTIALGGLAAPRRPALAVAAAAALGALDDVRSGPERGIPAHLRHGRTTGVAKLVGIPAAGALATRSVSGGILVGLCANALNQLDTRPGRALKGFALATPALRGSGLGAYAAVAVLLAPYDLEERMMLGDGGSNALGAVVGLGLVAGLPRRARLAAIGAVAGLNLLGERRSLHQLISSRPALAALDRLGRSA